VFKNKCLFIFILTVISCITYSPYFTSHNIGGGDAQYYFNLLADSLKQVENKIFPIYVGQSIFETNGISQINAPLYYIFANIINFATFSSFNAIYIQHLTIILSAVFASNFLFLALIKIGPSYKFEAFLISILYITSPGVASLIYFMDSYFAFLTIPFIPLIFYCLVQIYNRENFSDYLIFSISLSLVWMAHPPIALWVTFLCVLFCLPILILGKGKIIYFFSSGFIFIALNIWQIIGIFSFEALKPISINELRNLQSWIILTLKESAFDSLLPLNFATKPFYWLQLGYTLWLFLFISFFIYLKKPVISLFSFFLSLSLFLIIILFPNPIGSYFWEILPSSMITITNFYPNTRIYVILAALVCFISFFSIQQIHHIKNRRLIYFIEIILFIGTFWSLYQMSILMNKAITQTDTQPSHSWLNTENIHYPFFGLTTEFINNELFPGSHIPVFQARILSDIKTNEIYIDPKQELIKKCFETKPIPLYKKFHNQKVNPANSIIIFNLSLKSNKNYFICGKILVTGNDASFYLSNNKRQITQWSQINFKQDKWQIVSLPVNLPNNINGQEGDIPFTLSLTPFDNTIASIDSFHYTEFNTKELPIKIISLTPYTISTELTELGKTLEIIKNYQKGYSAKVNQKSVEVYKSERGTILIPIDQIGSVEVELAYVGTNSMRISFYLSVITWACCLIYFLLAYFKSKKS